MNILITIPHCSGFVPKKYAENYLIFTSKMDANSDYATDKIFEFKNFPVVKALASRFVVDLNRERDDFSEGQGVIITESWTGEKVLKKKLTYSEVEERLKEFYDPFYEKLDSFLKGCKKPLFVLDGHSMDSRGSLIAGDITQERPEICIATGNGTASEEIISLFENDLKSAGYDVKRNNPYAGKRAKIINYCSVIQGVQAIELEINKKLYMDEETFLLKEDAIKKLRKTLLQILKKVEKS